MSGKDEKPENLVEASDLECPHCGEMVWVRRFARYGIACYEPGADELTYASDMHGDLEWIGDGWICDFCDRLAPAHITEYLDYL